MVWKLSRIIFIFLLTAVVKINEIIHPSRMEREHFISMLYECTLTSNPSKKIRYVDGTVKTGQWRWHDKCPDDLLKIHELYRKFI